MNSTTPALPKAFEVTPHADGRAAGAPELSLGDILEMRQKLHVTGVDSSDAHSHVHNVCTGGHNVCTGGQATTPGAVVIVQERVWAAMTDPTAVSSSKEHQRLAALFETHAGDLEKLYLARIRAK